MRTTFVHIIADNVTGFVDTLASCVAYNCSFKDNKGCDKALLKIVNTMQSASALSYLCNTRNESII